MNLSPLLTDHYQLTMAAGYQRAGLHQRRACFHLFFRRAPFGGAYAIAAGLEQALAFAQGLRFTEDELAHVRSMGDFSEEFLTLLRGARSELDISALPEGSLAFPHEPLLRVEGPLWQAQLVESALINMVGFQTLIATKAARVCAAATRDGHPQRVLEFGMRRAQGIDGALAASRAAYIGGCAGTSHVLAAKRYGIPSSGTHAHSWVMAFESEREAFETYAAAFPKSAILLVDTYDTLRGVELAAEIGLEMRRRGDSLRGIRIDSGDLVTLSQQARAILDARGLEEVAIVASDSLDEQRIAALNAAGAKIDIWGVGTNLVTASDQPALGAVYKLAALEDERGVMRPTLKIGGSALKTSIPGRLKIVRHLYRDHYVMDAITDADAPQAALARAALIHPERGTPLSKSAFDAAIEPMQPYLRRGIRIAEAEPITALQTRAREELARLPAPLRALKAEAEYPLGLAPSLHALRTTLVRARLEAA